MKIIKPHSLHEQYSMIIVHGQFNKISKDGFLGYAFPPKGLGVQNMNRIFQIGSIVLKILLFFVVCTPASTIRAPYFHVFLPGKWATL